VGFPIRKSTGQSLFAAHRSLSQRTTSFIASCRQGILRNALRSLDRSHQQCPPEKAGRYPRFGARARVLLLLGTVNTAYRKTSCIEIDPNERLAVSEPPIPLHQTRAPRRLASQTQISMRQDQTRTSVGCPRLGRIPSSQCQTAPPLRLRRIRYSSMLGRGSPRSGGARRDRTDDLLLAKQALSQLSYGPFR
jgi:hypothetical protein